MYETDVSQADRANMLMKLSVLLLLHHMTSQRPVCTGDIAHRRCRTWCSSGTRRCLWRWWCDVSTSCALKPNESFCFNSASDAQLCSCLAESILKLKGADGFQEMRQKRSAIELFGSRSIRVRNGIVLTQANFPKWSHFGSSCGTESVTVVTLLLHLLFHFCFII